MMQSIITLIIALLYFEVSYAVEVLRAYPTKIWGEFGSEKGQFRNPYGIDIDNQTGDIFVSDCQNNTIKKYNNKGRLLKEWGEKGGYAGQFNYPAEVLVTENRELLVSDEKNHRIHKYDLNGNFLGFFSEHDLNNPLGIAENSTGNVIVADYLNRRVKILDKNGLSTGVYAGKKGEKSFDPDKFWGAYYVEVDDNDRIYVSDPSLNRIQVFDKHLRLLDVWGVDYEGGGESFGKNSNDVGRFSGIHKIFYKKDSQELWVADLYNDRIQVFDQNGEISRVIETPGAKPKIVLPLDDNRFLTGGALSSTGILQEWNIQKEKAASYDTTTKKPNTKNIHTIQAEGSLPEKLSSLLDRFSHKTHVKHDYDVNDLFYIPDGTYRKRFVFLPKGKDFDTSGDLDYTLLEDTLFLLEIYDKKDSSLKESRVIEYSKGDYVIGSYQVYDEISLQKQKKDTLATQECLSCHMLSKNGLLGFDKNTNMQLLSDNFITQSLDYLSLNCAYCHNGMVAPDFGIGDITGNVDLRETSLWGFVDVRGGDNSKLTFMLRNGIMPPIMKGVDEQGLYLLNTLINNYTGENILSDAREKIDFINLKVKKRFFGIQGLNATQGVEFLNNGNLFFANGYVNSLALIQQKKQGTLVQFEKIENPDRKEPALVADVSSDEKGYLYATPYRTGQLLRYDSDLSEFVVIIDGLQYPIGVDATTDNIFLANYGDDELIKMNKDGEVFWRKEFEDEEGKDLHRPYGVEQYNEHIFVSFNRENKIAKISTDGKMIKTIGPNLPDGTRLNNTQGLSIDKKGYIYTIDTKNKRIVVFDSNLDMKAVLFDKEFGTIRGIDVDNTTGDILVSGFPYGAPLNEENTGAWFFESVSQHLH